MIKNSKRNLSDEIKEYSSFLRLPSNIEDLSHQPSYIIHLSDCTGGRAAMQFDTASQNNLKKKSFIRNGKI